VGGTKPESSGLILESRSTAVHEFLINRNTCGKVVAEILERIANEADRFREEQLQLIRYKTEISRHDRF
jgi:hypothetical protein